MKREWTVRNIYLYLVSFVTLIMIVVGTVQLVRSAVDFIYPPPSYYYNYRPLEIEEKLPPEAVEEERRLELERQEQEIRYQRARRVAEALALLIVASPVYLYHWRKIQQEAGLPG